MRKRYYIMFVGRDADGELVKMPIPLHYLYIFVTGALIGMLTITGMAGSYTRMLVKVARFNQLRTDKEAVTRNYHKLEQADHEKDVQVASLGSLASEVSALYGLKNEPGLLPATSPAFDDENVSRNLNQLTVLKSSAMNGIAASAIPASYDHFGTLSTADWVRIAAAPSLWPVEGMVSSSFGERIDPFNGEGAFHTGIDISAPFGTPIIAPADGVVDSTSYINGYGRAIILDHGHGITTLYGHLSGFAVADGESVHRGDVIGFVGSSGRSTGSHLHYEVRIHNTPVNPHKYLRTTWVRGASGLLTGM
ncbi:MAG TPA: M23 family metallopeptidase [Terriglobales bacterium]|nr:M23 family metallopeptidase [Terriglobales bacterium]